MDLINVVTVSRGKLNCSSRGGDWGDAAALNEYVLAAVGGRVT